MDIRQLRYFVSVVEAKSLNKASAVLHVAQPALSTQIRKLESELGLKLLDRHARGVVPTKAGRRLAKYSYHVLRQVEQMRSDLTRHSPDPRVVVVLSIARSIPHTITTAIAERCAREFPDVQLTLAGSLRQQADRLSVDLALTFFPEPDGPFLWEPLIQDELVLMCSANGEPYPPEIDLKEAFQQSLILPSQPDHLRRLVDAGAQSGNYELRIACEVDSFEVTKELVARNVANAILPIASAREEARTGKVRLVRIKKPRLRRILYMSRVSRPGRFAAIEPLSRMVRSVILEHADDEALGWKKIASTEAPWWIAPQGSYPRSDHGANTLLQSEFGDLEGQGR
jgi:DNA-binding transcriptional LysR family regulator